MGKTTKILMALAIVMTLVFGGWATVRSVKAYQFDKNCLQYIERAAIANTVDSAKEELFKAISYVEENNLTEGIVSIVTKQPKK